MPMPYQELLILLPCHSLEDFPTYHEGDDADGLLSAWSAMWHPAFLASAGTKPGWCRVDSPPVELAQRLLIVPTVAQQQLPTGFAQRAKDAGACLVRRLHKRDDIVAAALAGLGPDAPAIDADLAADFMALGYCYLEVQLLTRQMRYASNLDELHFQNLVVAGARAARDGDLVLAREKLQACFDMLAEERNHYYPVEAYLLDVILAAPTTVGASLRTELATDSPASLLINGSCLEQMSAREPETMTAVCGAIQADRLSLIGGEAEERRWPLLGHESILAELRRGGTLFERLVGARPAIYGRRRFGLTPALPQILSRLGFRGALHATLDDGRFPQGSQLKVRWEGGDGTGIDAVARPPLDASKPQTFLSLAMKLGESMDSDHVATLMLAHWPGQASPWLDVLRRVAKYSPAMGRFVSFEKYFRDTDPPGQIDRFEVDQYRSPYLKQAIIRRQVDPISSSVRYWRRRALLESLTAYDTLLTLAGGPAPVADSEEQRQRAAWAEQTDQRPEDAEPDLATAEAFDAELAAAAQRGAERLAAALPHSKSAAGPGYLL
ncbi:MAG TPA: hypothetical protein PLV92_11150, partial [Pirellulaceae bacterium]|nr:hypothetical protein [Pirellulaceae bacterium]